MQGGKDVRALSWMMSSYHQRQSLAKRRRDFQRQIDNPPLGSLAPICDIDDEEVIPGLTLHDQTFNDVLTEEMLWDEHENYSGPRRSTVEWMQAAIKTLDAMHTAFPGFLFAYSNLPNNRGLVRRTPVSEQHLRNRFTAISMKVLDDRSIADASGHFLVNHYLTGSWARETFRWPWLMEAIPWLVSEIRAAFPGKPLNATWSPFLHSSLEMLQEPLFSDHFRTVYQHYDSVNLWSWQRPWHDDDVQWYDKLIEIANGQ